MDPTSQRTLPGRVEGSALRNQHPKALIGTRLGGGGVKSPSVDRIWILVYYNKILYPIVYLLNSEGP